MGDASTYSLTEYESYIDIKTPFSDFHHILSKMIFQDDGSHFFTKFDAIYGAISNSFETSGTYKFTQNTHTVNADAKVTSDLIQDIVLVFNFAKEYRNINLDTSFQWSGRKNIA